MKDNARIHILVSGRVQGVLFREHARVKAIELGLLGFAKNLIDGKVEIVIEGSKEKAEQFVGWAKQGSPLSRVDNVEIAEEEYLKEFENFIIREFGF